MKLKLKVKAFDDFKKEITQAIPAMDSQIDIYRKEIDELKKTVFFTNI